MFDWVLNSSLDSQVATHRLVQSQLTTLKLLKLQLAILKLLDLYFTDTQLASYILESFIY